MQLKEATEVKLAEYATAREARRAERAAAKEAIKEEEGPVVEDAGDGTTPKDDKKDGVTITTDAPVVDNAAPAVVDKAPTERTSEEPPAPTPKKKGLFSRCDMIKVIGERAIAQ